MRYLSLFSLLRRMVGWHAVWPRPEDVLPLQIAMENPHEVPSIHPDIQVVQCAETDLQASISGRHHMSKEIVAS